MVQLEEKTKEGFETLSFHSYIVLVLQSVGFLVYVCLGASGFAGIIYTLFGLMKYNGMEWNEIK
jgi:hypothetical protein